MFRHAPKLDWDEVRDDIDEYVDQTPVTPSHHQGLT